MLYYRRMGPNASYKRKQYLVDRNYQMRFVTQLLMVVLVVAALSALVASSILWRTMYFEEGSHVTLIACLIAVAITLLFELLLAIPIVFYIGIRQSHRIVGPMNRLKRTLEAIGQGDFSQRITCRKGDVLEDLAGAVNRMAESLEQRLPRPPQG